MAYPQVKGVLTTTDSSNVTQHRYVTEVEWHGHRVLLDGNEPCAEHVVVPMGHYDLPTPWLYCVHCFAMGLNPEMC